MSECEHDYVYNHEFRLTRCSKCLVVKKEFDWKAHAEKAQARVKELECLCKSFDNEMREMLENENSKYPEASPSCMIWLEKGDE